MSADTASTARFTDLTLVVTCYNHQSYIEQCLDALAAQTVPLRQVIVIDDRSKDDSANVIRRWLHDSGLPWTFVAHSQNAGLCASLNEALAMAEGTYFSHLSGDDWVTSDRFERQVTAFSQAPQSAAIMVSDLREVDAGGSTIVDHDFGRRLGDLVGHEAQPRLLAGLLSENVIPAPAVVTRTDLVREVGAYDESLAFEDYDLWLRLARRYSVAYEKGIVTNYRVVDSGLTRDPSRRVAMLTSEADALAKHTGANSTTNAIIAKRLLGLAGAIIEVGDKAALRRVLALAADASPTPWVRRAARVSSMPGGLARLRRSHGVELGIKPIAVSKKR
jgi:glycosyltransferase involved in cell wall biosynthesis